LLGFVMSEGGMLINW